MDVYAFLPAGSLITAGVPGELLGTARAAFVEGFHVTAAIGAALTAGPVLLIVALLVVALLVVTLPGGDAGRPEGRPTRVRR